jgi:hypothetical protein
MLKLHFITAQPDTVQYCWQTRVQIINLRQYGYSKQLRVLVLVRKGMDINPKWLELERDFPEVRFFWYMDTDDIYNKFINPISYEPLVRPNLLMCHFDEYRDLSKDAIFYLDSDVLFTRKIDFSKYLYDDICYLSDTIGYIGATYFDSKIHQVLPEKLIEYKKLDVLDNCTNYFNLSRKIAEQRENNSGGAQYLLKNVSVDFWKDVFDGSIYLKKYLTDINKEYFKSEEEGFQSFTADMWAVLYSLWKRGMKTECPKELSFAWSTDPISFIQSCNIYHDAGMTYRFNRGFVKGKYRNSEPIEVVKENYNNDYCTHWYVEQIEKVWRKK